MQFVSQGKPPASPVTSVPDFLPFLYLFTLSFRFMFFWSFLSHLCGVFRYLLLLRYFGAVLLCFFAAPSIYKTLGNAGTLRLVSFTPGFNPYRNRRNRTDPYAQRVLPSSAARAKGLAGSCERASEKAPGKNFERLCPARRLERSPEAVHMGQQGSVLENTTHPDIDGAGPPQFLPEHFV